LFQSVKKGKGEDVYFDVRESADVKTLVIGMTEWTRQGFPIEK
jgi:rhodanese-related sulfurtransferase